jgi:hypothetical protein
MSDAPITAHGNEIEVNGRQPEILGNAFRIRCLFVVFTLLRAASASGSELISTPIPLELGVQ